MRTDDNSTGPISNDPDAIERLDALQTYVRTAIFLARDSEQEFLAYLLSMSLLEINQQRRTLD